MTAPVDAILSRPAPGAASRAKYARWTAAERLRLAQLVKLGLNNVSLATEFGLKSPDCMTVTLRRFGLTRWCCTHWTDTKIAELAWLVAACFTNCEIAARSGVSIKRIEQLLQQHGIRRP